MAEDTIPRGELLEMFGRIEDKLDAVYAQTLKTNGRVTALEKNRWIERGAALQRAATIEDVRVVRATDLARKAWHKPAVAGVACTIIGALIAHFIG